MAGQAWAVRFMTAVCSLPSLRSRTRAGHWLPSSFVMVTSIGRISGSLYRMGTVIPDCRGICYPLCPVIAHAGGGLVTAASGFAVLGVEGSLLPYPAGPETVRAGGLDGFLRL